MVELGLTKSIGVSNCGTQVLLDMMTFYKIKPAVNQFECHPYLSQEMFVDLNLKLGVRPEAYAPLSVPSWKHRKDSLKELNFLKDPVILDLLSSHFNGSASLFRHFRRGRKSPKF